MMRTKHAGKVDAVQPEIVAALRKVGASVLSMASLGQGVPDLLVARNGDLWVIEVKGPKGTLTPDQVEWIGNWRSPVHIVRSVDDALTLVGIYTKP